MKFRVLFPLAIAAGAFLGGTPVFASGSHSGGHGAAAGYEFGQPAAAAKATRTIEVTMKDNLYEPESVAVQAGETIRFVITNAGEFVHEFNIGTPAMHARHQQEMMMMVEHGALEPDRINHDKMKMDMGNGMTMEHNDPNSALLEPGKTAEIVWTFTKAGNLEFACNVPGHYDAGMVGKLSVRPKKS